MARQGVTINNLLPGLFDTARLSGMMASRAKAQGITAEAALDAARAGIPTGRVGTPDEFGAMCAFLCSAHAGYIVGQNILMDGGQYPGTY